MIFKVRKTGSLATNCYIIGCPDTKEAVVVDPGWDGEDIINILEEENLTLKYIINTHGHGDHIGANGQLKEYSGAEILIHQADAAMLTDPQKNLSAAFSEKVVSPHADRFLQEGDVINVGTSVTLKVLHTPGHTPGGICLKGSNFILTGDTLFAGSIGRTDFPGGSFEELISSIKNKLFSLEGDYIIYPGHGPSSTLEKERTGNPFILYTVSR